MSHVDEGLLHAYLDGELDERRAGELEEHVAVCARCDDLFEAAIRVHTRAADLMARAAADDGAAPEWSELVRRARDADALQATERAEDRLADVPGPNFLIPGLAWAATLVLAFFLGWQASRRVEPPPITLEMRPEAAARAPAEDQMAAAPKFAESVTPIEEAPATQRRDVAETSSRQERALETAAAPPAAAPQVARKLAPTTPAAVAENVESRLAAAPELDDEDAASAESADGFRRIRPGQAAAWLGVEPLGLPDAELREASVGPGEDLPGIPGRPVLRLVYDLNGRDEPVVLLQRSVGTGDRARLPAQPAELVRNEPQPRAASQEAGETARRLVAASDAAPEAATQTAGETARALDADLDSATVTVRPDGVRSLTWLDRRGYVVVLEGALTEAELRALAARLQAQ